MAMDEREFFSDVVGLDDVSHVSHAGNVSYLAVSGGGDEAGAKRKRNRRESSTSDDEGAQAEVRTVIASSSDGDGRAWGMPTMGVKNTNWNNYEHLGGRVWNPDNIPLETYDLIRETDETVSAAMEFSKLAVKNKLGDYTHEDEEIQEFVRANLTRMKGGWKAAVAELFLTGNWAGASATELIWDLVPDFRVKVEMETSPQEQKPEPEGKPAPLGKESKVISYGVSIVLKGLQTLRPRSVTFNIHMDGGKRGEVKSVTQNLWTGYEVEIPVEKLIHYAHRSEYGNPYGKSKLRPVYIRWWIKDVLERAYGKTLERYAAPIIIGETEQINKEVTNLKGQKMTRGEALLRILEDLHDNSVIVKEPDQLIEILVSSKAVGKDFLDAIEYLNRAILRGLLYPSLIFDNTDVGSYSLGEGHQDILSLGLEADLENLQGVMITDMITPLVIYKFGPQEDYGSFSAVKIKAEDLKLWADIVTALTGVNVLDPGYLGDLNWIREKFGAEAMDEPFKREPAPGYDEEGNPIPVPSFDPQTGKPLGGGGVGAPGAGGDPKLPAGKEKNPRLSRVAIAEDVFERELREHIYSELAVRAG